MQKLYGSFGQPSGGSWKAALKEIRAGRDEIKRFGDMMTPYEAGAIERDLKQRCEAIYPAAAGAVIGEFKGAIKSYQDSLAELEAARAKEINRFDSARLNAEMQTLQNRVALVAQKEVNPLRKGDTPASVRLKAIYDEAVTSGDLHKQRAAFEVFKGLPVPHGAGGEGVALNALAKDAERAEAALRVTAELEQAKQNKIAALDALGQKQAQLAEVSIELGYGDPRVDFLNGTGIAKAYKLVEWPKAHRDGEVPSGEVIIHKETDAEVTGVLWPQALTEAGGS